jgi:hypothetical protein
MAGNAAQNRTSTEMRSKMKMMMRKERRNTDKIQEGIPEKSRKLRQMRK